MASTLRILLADDNELNRLQVSMLLEEIGHQVVEATNGEEAVTHFKAAPFDLILMDVQMPVLDGLAATDTIRKLEAPGRRTRILALTAGNSPEEQQACLAAGMDGILHKPLPPDVLFSAIEHLASPAPQGAQAGIDPQLAHILEQAGNSASLAQAMLEAAAEDLPKHIALAQQSLAAADKTGLFTALHTLKGMAPFFLSGPVQEHLAHVTELARQGNLPDIAADAARLETDFVTLTQQVDRLRDALNKLSD